MKVALVTNALNIGGKESLMFKIARKFRAQDIKTTFVITEAIGTWHTAPVDEGHDLLTVLPRPWQSKYQHARRVAHALAGADVVLLNHSFTAQSAVGLLPNETVAISILLNDHDGIYAVGLSNYINIDKIIAVSDRLRTEAILRGTPHEIIQTIRVGIEVSPHYPRAETKSVPSTPLKVIFVGRIEHEQKGVFYLPEIISYIRKRGTEIVLDIIGDGDDLRALRNRISGLLLDDIVRFHGSLPHDDTMEILGDADVLLMPSHFEGQPVTLFEAMARGVVPVVSRLKDITDNAITDGINGFLNPIGDETSFATSILELAENRNLLERMSKSAWSEALESFSLDDMIQKYMTMIEDCMERRRLGLAAKRNRKIDKSLLCRFPSVPLFALEIAAKTRNLCSL